MRKPKIGLSLLLAAAAAALLFLVVCLSLFLTGPGGTAFLVPAAAFCVALLLVIMRNLLFSERERAVSRFIQRFFREYEGEKTHEKLLGLLVEQLGAEGAEFSTVQPNGAVRCVGIFPRVERLRTMEEWKGEWDGAGGGLGGPLVRREGGRTRVIIPLAHGGELVGSVEFRYRSTKAFGWQQSIYDDIAGSLSPGIAATLANQRLAMSRESFRKAYRYTEEKFMNTVAELSDMVIFERNETITYINRAGLDLLGYSEPWEVLGRKAADFYMIPEDHEEFLRQLAATGTVKNFELILRKKNGEKTFALLSAVAVLEGGRVGDVVSIAKDVTERMENENKMRAMNLELTKANRQLKETHLLMLQQEKLASVGQLAAGIAHEINTPLGYVKSNVNTMSRFLDSLCRLAEEAVQASGGAAVDFGKLAERYNVAYIESETPSLTRETAEGIERIVRIINSLLRFSRTERKFPDTLFDLNTCVDDTLIIAGNELKHVVEVKKEYGDIPPVPGDSGEIGQVILNILVNAAQAIKGQGREGPGTITVVTSADEERVMCRITDDGPGIPEDVQQRIFDAFYTTKPVGYGTGLGLSISYDIIVKKHGGTIAVTSRPGQGASFLITLPRAARREVSASGDGGGTPALSTEGEF